jgi:acyl carrier protein
MTNEAKIKHLLHNLLGIDTSEVTSSCMLRERLSIDSIELVEIAVLLEQELKVRIEKPKELKTFGDLCRAVASATAQPQAAEAS